MTINVRFSNRPFWVKRFQTGSFFGAITFAGVRGVFSPLRGSVD